MYVPNLRNTLGTEPFYQFGQFSSQHDSKIVIYEIKECLKDCPQDSSMFVKSVEIEKGNMSPHQ